MELQARLDDVGVSAFGWLDGLCRGGTSATPGVQTVRRRYWQCPAVLETHDLRDVAHHIDEGPGGSGVDLRS
jgi:hypothetical protein